MITVSKEDYLKAVSEAEAEGQTVISATLAHWLSVTPPAVTNALKRLRKDGLVMVKSDGRIQLTAEGRAVAERTIFRHHLIERMLAEIFGMAWYEVHDEAERLEHAVSPAFEKKLVEKLGNKDVCPHGNGLVLRTVNERRKKGLRLLSEAEAGSSLPGVERLRKRPQTVGVPGAERHPPRCAPHSPDTELRRYDLLSS